MKYHVGFSKTGHQVHAVEYSKGQYRPRSVCGARIQETKRRIFSDTPDACRRCVTAVV